MLLYHKQFKNRFGRRAGKYLKFAIEADRELTKDFTTNIRQLRERYGDINSPIYSHLGLRSSLQQWKRKTPGFWTRHLKRKLRKRK